MCTILALPDNLRYKLARTSPVIFSCKYSKQIQPCLCFPNFWCQKATWRCMSGKERVLSVKQEQRSETCLSRRSRGERLPPTQLKFLAAAPPVIDHAGPQVSNNLSWHFIQAADQRGSGISGARSFKAWKRGGHGSTAGYWEVLRSGEPDRQSEVNRA